MVPKVESLYALLLFHILERESIESFRIQTLENYKHNQVSTLYGIID